MKLRDFKRLNKFAGFMAILFMLPLLFAPSQWVYADTLPDIEITIDQTSPDTNICYSQTPCTGYHYLKVQVLTGSFSYLSSKYIQFGYTGGSAYLSYYPKISEQIYNVDGDNLSYIRAASGGQNLDSTYSIKFTLSASLPGQTPCPEPEPCDCDRPFIVQLFEQGFWGVATAIVSLIVPILALFLLFRLVHDLLFKERL